MAKEKEFKGLYSQNMNRKALRDYFSRRQNAYYGKNGSGRKWSEMTDTQRKHVLNAIAETTLTDEEKDNPYISVNWHYSHAREKNRGDNGYHYVKSVVIDIGGRGSPTGNVADREEYRINSITFTDKNTFLFINAVTRNLYTLNDMRNKNLQIAELFGVKEDISKMINDFTLINATPTNFPSKKKEMNRDRFYQRAKQHLNAVEDDMYYRIKSIHGFDEQLFKDYTNQDPNQFFALTEKGTPRRYKNGKHVFKDIKSKRDYYALASDVIEQVVGFNDDQLNELFGSEKPVNDRFYAWLEQNHKWKHKGVMHFAQVSDKTKAKWYLEFVRQMNDKLGQEYRPPRIRIMNPKTAKGKAKTKLEQNRLKDLVNKGFGQ